MVLVQRRSASTQRETRRSSSSVAFGDGHTASSSQASGHLSTSPFGFSPESGRARSFSFDATQRCAAPISMIPSSWANRVLLFAVLLSWGFSFFITRGTWEFLREIKEEVQNQQTQYDETDHDLEEMRQESKNLQRHLDHVRFATRVMNHESRMRKELNETMTDWEFVHHQPVLEWLNKRQGKLKDKLGSLRKHVSEQSRAQVLEKFGPGPHRVKASIELAETGETGSFVIELAPVDLMPHSILIFLEQVERGLWDRTAFWHYDVIEHIISAASINYKTGEPKTHYFQALGVGELAFAEYSSDFPHEKYTIGFAGRGPHFYINIMDNTNLHGPGSQGHHDLPGDADPCFGKIVQGTGLVDAMYKSQLKEKKPVEERQNWQDEDLTHILSMEII